MNRNKLANGSDAKRRNQADDTTVGPSAPRTSHRIEAECAPLSRPTLDDFRLL